MNSIIRDRIFLLLCLTLPFLFIPVSFQLRFIGGPVGTMLMVYAILAAYAYTFYCYKKDKEIFIDKCTFLKFAYIYITIMFISLVHGLFIYQYYDLIFSGPIDQIEKLPKLINFLSVFNIQINEKFLLVVWMIISFFKGIILEIIYTFGFSYILYCWYKNEPHVAIKIIKHSIYYISVIIILFGVVELCYLFGYNWARDVLEYVNPWLHEIKANFNWWPPLLWKGRMRNIFPEPSFFGMYTAFIIPFLWAEILNGKRKLLNLTLVCFITLFMFLTQSKTAVLLFLGEVFLLSVYVLYKRVVWRKLILIFIAVILAAFISICCIENYNSKPFNNFFIDRTLTQIMVDNNQTSNIAKTKIVSKKSFNTADKYIKRNITGVIDPKSGSNNTRFAIMKSDIRIWQDHLFLGIGKGLKSGYTGDYLTPDERKIGEVKMWAHQQNTKGVLKAGYPSVSEYTKLLAEVGIIGLLIYVFPFLFILYNFFKKRKINKITIYYNNDVICMLIALTGSFFMGLSGVMTNIQTYWLLLGIAYAYVIIIKNKKMKV